MFNILVINAGSSSLKFKIFTKDNNNFKVITSGQFTKTNSNNPSYTINVNNNKISKDFSHKLTMEDILNVLHKEIQIHFKNLKIDAIGHRVVHGGDLYLYPVLVDQNVINNLKSIIYLTPIHMPHNIAPMEVSSVIFKNTPQIACFDTAFHSTIPMLQRVYAIPRNITVDDKIKRYGFHGLSYEYLIGNLAEYNNELANGKIIIAHLGAGASICALKDKKSIDTTMGLTPLEGLVMGTRCGSIDPSILLYLMKKGLDYQDITNILYFKSGLLGVSELSADFTTISSSDKPEAKEAYDLFINSVTKNILGLCSTLQGLDAIVFSGGIGENSYKAREDILTKLSWLGIELNKQNNNKNSYNITNKSSKIQAFIIPTQEELVIAKYSYNLVNNLS